MNILLLATDSTSFTYHMTGGLPIGEIWAAITFAMLGLILMTAINVRNGIVKNPKTADAFNWKYFGWGTIIRIILSALITMIVIFLSIRFAQELVGKTLSMFYALGVGLFIDRATQLLVKKRKTTKTGLDG